MLERRSPQEEKSAAPADGVEGQAPVWHLLETGLRRGALCGVGEARTVCKRCVSLVWGPPREGSSGSVTGSQR